MSELTIGMTVHLTNGQTAKVKKLLGEGGQGYVYLVDVAGRDMALKFLYSMGFSSWLQQRQSIRNPHAHHRHDTPVHSP